MSPSGLEAGGKRERANLGELKTGEADAKQLRSRRKSNNGETQKMRWMLFVLGMILSNLGWGGDTGYLTTTSRHQ